MTVLRFRRQIETLIGDLIGEYTLPNLVQTPAIRFREGEEPIDENVAVEGLEVILETSSPARVGNQYSGAIYSPMYAVRLVQWSGSNYEEAVERIVSTYDNHEFTPTRVPPEIGPTKQCVIFIQSSAVIEAGYKYTAP